MAMFQSILPQNQQPEAPALPPGLLALLPKGAGITGGLAQDLASAAPFGGPTYAPGQPPLPSAVPGATNGPPAPPVPAAPVMSAPLIGAPTMDPTQSALLSAGEAAAGARVYDSPLATLASSVLAGLRSGATTFAAQKQANREGDYKAEVQKAIQEKSDNFVNNDRNFGPGGLDKKYQAVLQGMTPEERAKFLVAHDIVKAPEFATFGEGGIYDKGTGTVVREPSRKMAQGEAIERVNPDGTKEWFIPNPKPPETAWSRLDSDMVAAATQIGAEYGKNLTPKQAEQARALVDAAEIRKASAGRTPTPGAFANAVALRRADALAKGQEAANGEVQAAEGFKHALDIVKGSGAGEVITGNFAAARTLAAKFFDKPSAQATQEYIAAVTNAINPKLRATLGPQFTEKEGERMIRTAGGDPTLLKASIESILADRVRESVANAQRHNASVADAVRRNPGDQADAFQVAIPAGLTSPGTAAPGARKVGDTWTEGGFTFRVAPDGSIQRKAVTP